MGGLLLLIPAVALGAYGLFALGWDGGTDRVWGDLVLIGLAALMAVAAFAMMRGRTWGAVVGFGLLFAVLLLTTAGSLLG